jgi:hypothetical protein
VTTGNPDLWIFGKTFRTDWLARDLGLGKDLLWRTSGASVSPGS